MKKITLYLIFTFILCSSIYATTELLSYYPVNGSLIALYDFNHNASEKLERGLEETVDRMQDILIYNGTYIANDTKINNPKFIWYSAWNNGLGNKTLSSSRNFTMYFELRPNSMKGVIFRYPNEIIVDVSGSNIRFYLYDDCTSVSAPISLINHSSVVHIAVNFNNHTQNASLYYNGTALDWDDTCNPNLGGVGDAIGLGSVFDGSNPFNGSILTFAVWNASLNNTLMKELSNGTYEQIDADIVSPSYKYIGCVGDSILVHGSNDYSYCELLANQTELYRTWNFGESGDTSWHLNQRTALQTFDNKYLDITTLMIGTNDMDNSSAYNSTLDDYYNNISMAVKSILDGGSNVTLLTIPPCNDINRGCNTTNQSSVIYRNNIVRQIVYDFNLSYCDLYTNVFRGFYNITQFTDAVHPSNIAQREMNDSLSSCLLNQISFDCSASPNDCYNYSAPAAASVASGTAADLESNYLNPTIGSMLDVLSWIPIIIIIIIGIVLVGLFSGIRSGTLSSEQINFLMPIIIALIVIAIVSVVGILMLRGFLNVV